MFIVHSYTIAVGMCSITMLCWGSWANATKLVDAKRWPFQLFYWDYSFGILLFSLLMALTLGSFGSEGRSFLADISQAHTEHFWSAVIGGFIFNLGNILLVAAIDLAGMAVAFPVGVGLALVLGVVTNYISVPQGSPFMIFSGVLAVVIAMLLTAEAYKRISLQKNSGVRKGLITAILAGLIMGWFFYFVADSMSVDFVHPEPGKLTPYTALVFFSIGVFVSNFIWNVAVMKKPISGNPVSGKAYFQGSMKEHLTGILGGAVWCLGMGFSLLASGSAGYAISYGLGQGATMIAVAWGVFIWKEFALAPKGTNPLLCAVFAFYILGLILIIAANN
ncbi:hypothetical protein CI610_03465 [invertebrate metagenome]|uniref:Multidrug DMT transporter permease n=1 Tax=invertebrate metagenome TaxID=1711999 RepID=A0A2H9T2Z9_9ZZZZ